MKISRYIATATLLAIFAYSTNVYAVKTEHTSNNLEIKFSKSEQFSDTSTGIGKTERGTARVTKEVRSAFQKGASQYLPVGYKLKVDVTDIDLAGDRSLLTSRDGTIRVYKEIYPPRINFTYAIYNPQDQLVASGEAHESNMNYTFGIRNAIMRNDEVAPYVNELVSNWSARELKIVAKTE